MVDISLYADREDGVALPSVLDAMSSERVLLDVDGWQYVAAESA